MTEPRQARFEREVLSHMQAVYNAARRLTGETDAARDLAQDALLRAYRAFDGFTGGTNGRAWVLTIVYSVFVNDYRRRRRIPVHVSIDELEARHAETLAAPEFTPPDATPGSWSSDDVERAMTALPDAFRETVWLVDVEELSYEEAAAAMGCAIGTVRSRLFRARRVLAAALHDYASKQGLLTERRGER